jgi:23S rRNA (cytosine1962-C5)-methyltransferase
MKISKEIYLKPGKEIPVRFRHHWVFSGAIKSGDRLNEGEIVRVFSSRNEFLGHGYYNSKSIIQIRMLNFTEEDPIESIRNNIKKALKLRTEIFGDETNCYRVINGEGDHVSGLIIDRYDDVLVFQIATVGIDILKDTIIDAILEAAKELSIDVKSIYEKSTMSARTKDGLPLFQGVIWGEEKFEVEVRENGIKFFVDLKNAQKTGLFLDMREMRRLVGTFAKDKKVLNCFSYTGGFSLYAAQGGASAVDSVDIAPEAIVTAKQNFEINKLDSKEHGFFAEDAFKYLRDRDLSQYDFVILDPPAFAKKKTDVEAAKKGYAEINRTALRKMKSGTFLLTCSCSYHLPREDFEKVVSRAAVEAGKNVVILQRHRLGMDHPINLFHNELDYLKSMLLYVY